MMNNIKSVSSIVKDSKKLIEITDLEHPLIKLDHTRKSTRPVVRAARTTSENYERNRMGNYHKALKTVRRLIECNFEKKYSFITLTFKEPITDLNEANRDLKRFFERLRYQLGKLNHEPLKYIAVAEVQQKREVPAIHFHLVTNLTKSKDIELVERQWESNGHCNVRLRKSTHRNNMRITYYLLKQKHPYSGVPLGGNLYKTSRGLEKPKVKEFENHNEVLKMLSTLPIDCIHSEEFEIPGLGKRRVTQYYRKDALN